MNQRVEYLHGLEAARHATAPIASWLRMIRRGLALLATFAITGADFGLRGAWMRNRLLRRAQWLHRASQVFARAVGLQIPHGLPLPAAGMIVSNHLSYLDILAFGSLGPCVFVAKKEVASWPLLGVFAKMAGTIFIDRTRRADLVRVNGEIRAALDAGVTLVLFPEGTSSDGQTVLPLKPSALEPLVAERRPVTAAAIAYELAEGSVADEVCYWGEMTLFPHLLNLLGKRGLRAGVAFGATEIPEGSRKELGVRLREEIRWLQAVALGRSA